VGPRDVAQEICGVLGLRVRHARDRLVDQQQLGVLRQQHADLEPLFLAMAQITGAAMAMIEEADTGHDRVDLIIGDGIAGSEQRRTRRAGALEREA